MFKKIAFVGNLVLLIMFAACSSRTEEAENPFPIDTTKYSLLSQSKEDYNEIQVYQLDHIVVVNAKSESEFFDGAQFAVEAENELSTEDVTITWTTLMGGTEKTEENDRIIAEIIIQDNGTTLLDKKINFMKKPIDAITDVLIDRME